MVSYLGQSECPVTLLLVESLVAGASNLFGLLEENTPISQALFQVSRLFSFLLYLSTLPSFSINECINLDYPGFSSYVNLAFL